MGELVAGRLFKCSVSVLILYEGNYMTFTLKLSVTLLSLCRLPTDGYVRIYCDVHCWFHFPALETLLFKTNM